ncbi:TAP-like protein-domain-containing protein [Tricharina praecox]|uniref:TAP-like protein-domain-containing protein n=1 Tax=Tricharina praecox TaxID=43433 RepID=UPI00222075A9|nr:TAP-like protein-domain-containing protein [Tricharina praecox]KAI5854108.1 TAP-like protein-domain-containing protein [Tricharina praecox]
MSSIPICDDEKVLLPKANPTAAFCTCSGCSARSARRARKLQLLYAMKQAVLVTGICVVAMYVLWGFHTGLVQISTTTPSVTAATGKFRWTDITPTSDLIWHPCFDGLACARLDVPLDYTNSSDPRRAAIALTKVPASVPETSDAWSGPVLLNPGGPGGSGVAFVTQAGKMLQRIVGNTHSVIGFDPRGVNNTTPATSCFPSDAARMQWYLRAGGWVMGSGNGQIVAIEYARSMSLGSVCDKGGTGGDFAGTPNVARDMLSIVEASWKSVDKDPSKRGLRYWGFSYGTVLGQTFASMFPSRVERVVVDGVVDIDDYYAGGWRTNLQDADKVIASFYNYCSLANGTCALSEPTAAGVEARVTRLREKVRQEPAPVYGDHAPDWVTESDILTVIFWSLYTPLIRFPVAAHALASLENGDASKVVEIIHLNFECNCVSDPLPNTGTEADSAILCQDGGGNNATLDEFRGYVKELQGQSALIGGNWARIQMSCVGRKTPAQGLVPWRRDGESGWGGHTWGKNTSYPLLFASTSLDPVTPLRNAEAMRKRFPGAGLLIQHSEGHCSISTPSACSAAVVGKYFETGKVEDEVECEADARPWDAISHSEFRQESMFLAESWDPVVPGGWK